MQPMLAGTAKSVEEALAKVGGEAAVEFKLDGARIQVHRDGDDVGVFTRSLDDITARVPELVAAALALPADVARPRRRGDRAARRRPPHPFQVTASPLRLARRHRTSPLTGLFFDVLHLDGEDLLDAPLRERAAPRSTALGAPRVPQGDARRTALAAGHEGVVVKALDAPYAAGRRGAGWLKVKPVHTLDLVVLAVEHGAGRRRGWLSNLHLGTRELRDARQDLQGPDRRDAALADRAPARARRSRTTAGSSRCARSSSSRSPSTACSARTRYPGGVALRFARVLRHRPDKRPAEADTLETVLSPSCVASCSL